MNLKAMNNKWRIVAHSMVCCLLLIATLRCEAQGNLVPNPSFELLTDTCPCNIGFQGTAKPLYWEKWNQSPDYFNSCVDQTCAFDTLIDVPQNGFGFQYALDGDAYVGMAAYDGWNDFREYVGCQLIEPLEVGTTYYLSFHTNLALDGSYWLYGSTQACNNIGLLFSMEPNIWTDVDQPPFALRNHAHLHSAAVITDTAGWTFVSGTFVADSAYPYLVIGNFFSDSLTDMVPVGAGLYVGYYFVDGVCVSTDPEGCPFQTALHEDHRPTWDLFPNPANEEVNILLPTADAVDVRVFDAHGRSIWNSLVRGEVLVLPVRDWANGQYHLLVEGKEVRHARFVVLH